LSLNSCKNEETIEKDPIEKPEQETFENFEDQVLHEITAKLQIPSTEKFSHKIYWENLNPDSEKDAIITVNRLDYAREKAAATPNPSKLAEMGYIGNYNFFFFYDGKKKRFSVPIPVPSSALNELKISFKNIQSASLFKDLIIEYRIQNAAFHNYYMLEGDMMNQVFQWKVFDNLGTNKSEANFFELGEGKISLTKDILIYTGKVKNLPATIEDVYSFQPEIEKTNNLVYRFFYDPATRKYTTIVK
jgi:hypothetical protein